jgi:hypothetical protein
MYKYFFVSMGLLLSTILISNGQNNKAPLKEEAKGFNIQFGNTTHDYTLVTKEQFKNLTKMPIYLKDDDGRLYLSKAFELLYAEWGLFEDSTGRDRVMVDYHPLSVVGSEIPEYFYEYINSIAKGGDTLSVFNVWSEKKDSQNTSTIAERVKVKKYIIQ